MTQAQRMRLGNPRDAGAPFTLVTDYDGFAAVPAQQGRYIAIRDGNAFARIHQEQDHVGFSDRDLGLLLHSVRQAAIIGVFKTGRINQTERQTTQTAVAFAPIAGNTWAVIHQGKFLACQSVKKCRFPDIGPPDYCDRWEIRHQR
jgi:hypothetical protein